MPNVKYTDWDTYKGVIHYHLSFNDSLPETLHPRQPDGYIKPQGKPSIYYEDLPERISFAPTLLGCWMGIYSNISKYFEEEFNYPYLIMQVYRGVPNKHTKYIHPDTLRKRLWDYHLTEEIAVVSDIRVKYQYHVKIKNPLINGKYVKETEMYGYAFNDDGNEKRFIAPKVNFEIMK